VDESVVQVLDIAPTLLDYAGNLKFPTLTVTNIPEESVLLRPEKRNSNSLKQEPSNYGEYGATRFIRMNATTKYISRLTRAHKHLNLHEDHSQELFDLTHDQNETSNLINSKAITQEYLAELQSYEKSLQDWFTPSIDLLHMPTNIQQAHHNLMRNKLLSNSAL
jgi:arylsulfatase A-like enzyme